MEKQIATERLTSGIANQAIEIPDVMVSPNQPAYADLPDEAQITKGNLIDVLPDPTAVLIGKALAGTPNPAVIPFEFGTDPFVTATFVNPDIGAGETKTNRGLPLQYDLVFTDNTLTTLVSVNIWGNDNGGLLNEDVYYRIQG